MFKKSARTLLRLTTLAVAATADRGPGFRGPRTNHHLAFVDVCQRGGYSF